MLNASSEFKQLIYDEKAIYECFLDITLADGTKIETVKNKQIWENSLTIEDSTSELGKFTIGAVIAGKMSVTLNNIYDDFSPYDFSDADIVLHIGLYVNDKLEKIRIGTYKVDTPSYDGTTITLECIDNIHKLNVSYDEIKTIYPSTLDKIVKDILDKCGLNYIEIPNEFRLFSIPERPETNMSCGSILAMACQMTGNFAKCDEWGRIFFSFYKIENVIDGDDLKGGSFVYTDGDSADGGDFLDYSSGDSYDGGTFENFKYFHNLYNLKNFSCSTDDVIITGLSVKNTEDNEYTIDSEGEYKYIISISGNALIQGELNKQVAEILFEKLQGFRFRPLTATLLSNPLVESGDIAYVIDRKDNGYKCFISNRRITIGGSLQISCDAESPRKNSSMSFSAESAAIIQKTKKQTQKQITEYDKSVQMLTQLMSQSFGIFKTEQVLEDGSTVYYMHNKPLLKDSDTQWKMTANALAVSTDFGKTWKAGIDSQGNAVVNVLSAVGINADWVNAGILQGMTIIGSEIISNGTLVFHHENYTSADLERANNIILNKIVPTLADYRKYDIDGNGIITMSDYVKIEKLVGGQDYSYDVNMRVNPSYNNDVITIETDGQPTLIISRKGINCNSFTANGFHLNNSNGNYHAFNNGVELPGVSGTLRDSYGQTITVANGIIVGII